MAFITKITTQVKNTERYNVFLDYGNGEEYAFSVDEDVLIKFRLGKGMELDEFSLSEISFQDDIQKAYHSSVQFLARRMRTEGEVRNYLKDKQFDEPIIQEVIHKLYEYNFLNDEEFAFAYVRTQMNTTDKGSELIKRELKEKAINEKIIEKAIKEYPFEKQFLTAKLLGEKFSQKNMRDSDRIVRQKIEQLLLRKGFSFEVIASVLEEMGGKEAENKELEALRYQGEKAHRKYSGLSAVEYNRKVKEVLYRKGFSLDLIDQFLNDKREEFE
jgi:regulatory protein